MPALRVDPEPVERAVGNLEVARGGQRPPGGAAIHDVEHAAVADRGDGLAGVMARQPVDAGRHAVGEGGERFAGPEIVVQVARQVMRMRRRMAFGRLGRGQSLEAAIVALAQRGQQPHRFVLARRQCAGGFLRAFEIAAVDRGKAVVRGVVGHGQGLRPSGRVERDVGMALDAPVGVPVGFAVADQAAPRRDGTGCGVHFKWIEFELYRIWHKKMNVSVLPACNTRHA